MADYTCKDCGLEFTEEEAKQVRTGVVPFIKKENLCNLCYQRKNYQSKKRKKEMIEVDIYLPKQPHRRATQIAANWWKMYVEYNELFEIIKKEGMVLKIGKKDGKWMIWK